jgi:maltose alpha-D-glucosyltransferase/alpha-amylase
VGDSPVVPRDLSAMMRALAVLELEKAVYELGYEMNNRPDWIGVPLQAVLALAGEGPR